MGGFIVVDKVGEFVAWAADAEVAVKRMRTEADGEFVYRCSDDVLIASKLRKVMTSPPDRSGGRPFPYLPDHLG